MIDYKDILNEIKEHNGNLITIIKDVNSVNYDFILSIQNDLESEYTIETNLKKIWNLNLNEITKKTIFFIDYYELGKDKIERDKKIRILTTSINNNTTIICIRYYVETSIYGQSLGQLPYISSLILLLYKEKLKVLKSRYKNFSGILDLIVTVRKLKLKKLSKK